MNNKSIYILWTIILIITGCAAKETREPAIGHFDRTPILTPFYDKYWLLLEDFTYYLNSSGDKITVPAGFVSDLASVPDGANAIFDQFGRYASAALIHDYLYWEKIYSKSKSDKIIKDALKATGVGYTARNSIKWGVKLFGDKSWKKNCSDRRKGYPRLVPVQYRRQFNVSTKWTKYRADLINKGITSNNISQCEK